MLDLDLTQEIASLRTTFRSVEGEPAQVIGRPVGLAVAAKLGVFGRLRWFRHDPSLSRRRPREQACSVNRALPRAHESQRIASALATKVE